MSTRISPARIVAVVAVAFALTLSWTGIAFAGPGEPTLGLTALRSRLDSAPGGTLAGYFKTVTRGATIETIPVTVLAVTGDGSDSLIMFEALGAKIELYGGIASGMSGSPIYIEDGGTDKVIGAVAYGESFTLAGYGLAAPIESMLQLETDYAPRVQMLSSPVRVDGRLIDRIVITADAAVIANVAAPTAFVAQPLASIYIGGLAPGSRTFANLRASLERSGLAVQALDTRLSAGTSTFETDLVPGSSMAILATRGDLWVGGIGTTTWTDGTKVLAFGHPAFFMGETDLYMCNAWISGIWPSSLAAYKVGYPTAVRGAITQDRDAGIMGMLGDAPAEALISSRAYLGSREATGGVYIPSTLFDSGQLDGLPAAAGSVAASRLFDAQWTPGSATTTTTVLLSDGTREYTVRMTNLVDNANDIPSSVGGDAEYAISSLLSVLDYGVEQPHIISADVEASVSTRRASARIVGVSLDEPLHEGDNHVTVSLLAWGAPTTQTVEALLTVPEGTPLAGTITAAGTVEPFEYPPIEEPAAPKGRDTIAAIVDRLNAELPGNCVVVSFAPEAGEASFGAPQPESAECTASAPWVINGTMAVRVSQLTAELSSGVIAYGGSVIVSGEITGPTDDVVVQIYGTPAGSSTETLLAEESAVYSGGVQSYEVFLSGLTTNTSLRVSIEGGTSYTPAEATALLGVRADIRLSPSARTIRFGRRVTFTARVVPGTAHGSVRFQYYDAAQHRWRTVGTKMLRHGSSYATASLTWMPRWGKRAWRAVYSGDAYNRGVVSSSLTTRAN